MQINNNTNNSTNQVNFKKINKLNLQNTEVKALIQGNNYVEVSYSQFKQNSNIKKISKNEYVNVHTGEIKAFNYDTNDTKISANLLKTFNNLRRLIRTNFTQNSKNQLFITLTYAENMTDEKRLYIDFNNFYKRLKRKFKNHKFDYIAVAEPQGRGAWHIHLMLKSDQPTLFIDNAILSDLWQNGYTDTQRLKSDDVGSYYVAYFTDLLEEDEQGNKKRAKGERLSLYPKNFKFYRTSRGIKKPIETIINYDDIINNKAFKSVYSQSFSLEKDNQTINTYHKETFKRI